MTPLTFAEFTSIDVKSESLGAPTANPKTIVTTAALVPVCVGVKRPEKIPGKLSTSPTGARRLRLTGLPVAQPAYVGIPMPTDEARPWHAGKGFPT